MLENCVDLLISHLEKETQLWRQMDIKRLTPMIRQKERLAERYMKLIDQTTPQECSLELLVKIRQLDDLVIENKYAIQGAFDARDLVIAVLSEHLGKEQKPYAAAYDQFGKKALPTKSRLNISLGMNCCL